MSAPSEQDQIDTLCEVYTARNILRSLESEQVQQIYDAAKAAGLFGNEDDA